MNHKEPDMAQIPMNGFSKLDLESKRLMPQITRLLDNKEDQVIEHVTSRNPDQPYEDDFSIAVSML